MLNLFDLRIIPVYGLAVVGAVTIVRTCWREVRYWRVRRAMRILRPR